MIRWLTILVLWAVCWMWQGVALAEEKSLPTTQPTTTRAADTQPDGEKAEEKKSDEIPISFKDAPMDQIAKFIREHDAQKRVIFIDEKAKGKKVTLDNPNPLPPAEAMEMLLIAMHEAGVTIEERDKTLHLVSLENIKRMQLPNVPVDELDQVTPGVKIVRTFFQVDHYDPEKMVEVLDEFKPDFGYIMIDPQTRRRLIAVAPADRLQAMARLIARLDRDQAGGGELRVFDIEKVDVYEIMPTLVSLVAGYVQAAPDKISWSGGGQESGRSYRRDYRSSSVSGSSSVGTVTIRGDKEQVMMIPDVRESKLVVRASNNVLVQIEAWLKVLDVQKPVIENQEFYEVKYSDPEELSYRMGELLNNLPDESLRSSVRIIPFVESRRLMILGPKENRDIIVKWLDEIDVATMGVREIETIFLQHADAPKIAESINELFDANQGVPYWRRRDTDERDKITATADSRNNSVTVVASPEKLGRIKAQIEIWDQPLDMDDVEPLIYTLKYAEPEATAELLNELFNEKQDSSDSFRRWWYSDWDDDSSAKSPVGRLFGQFRIEAYPETGKLVIFSNSKENYKVIQKMIEQIDQPQISDLPLIIELKFADAETLAEQLNALLNAPGTKASILRRGRIDSFEGLTEFTSPYSQSGGQQQPSNNQQDEESRRVMEFWWQQRPGEIRTKQPSNLVGKVRIVPNIEQNLLIVAAPEEYALAIKEFVARLDKPGYQVLVKATIVEITHDDSTSLGYRFSTDPTVFTSGDPLITEHALRGLFQYDFEDNWGRQHTVTFDMDVNNLLNLLRKITNLKIKSTPNIFTADNVEGEFFDGQDVPFLSSTRLLGETANRDVSYDYFPVGIRLRVRPHITEKRNIALTVNLIVSEIQPGRELFGGAVIVNRRETNTRVFLEDGQTFLISGILREEDREINRRIPGLGDIPLLGELFKHREIVKANTELMIFLTPYVISPTVVEGDPDDDRLDPIQKEPLQRLRDMGMHEDLLGSQQGPGNEEIDQVDLEQSSTELSKG